MMPPDSTIGQIETTLSGFPRAVAGVETAIANGLHSLFGGGEYIAQALGLSHVAGIVQKISTGTDSVLQKVDAGEQVIATIGQVAQGVTPPQIAGVIVPHSAAVLAAAQTAADFVTKNTNVPAAVATVVKHNLNLIHIAHEIVLGAETVTDVAEKVPFFNALGLAASIVAGVNASLHGLEPILAKYDTTSATS
jgi:hypothetical protein